MNKYEHLSYLDPKPVNLTQCQSLDTKEFEKSRHLDVSFKDLCLFSRLSYDF